MKISLVIRTTPKRPDPPGALSSVNASPMLFLTWNDLALGRHPSRPYLHRPAAHTWHPPCRHLRLGHLITTRPTTLPRRSSRPSSPSTRLLADASARPRGPWTQLHPRHTALFRQGPGNLPLSRSPTNDPQQPAEKLGRYVADLTLAFRSEAATGPESTAPRFRRSGGRPAADDRRDCCQAGRADSRYAIRYRRSHPPVAPPR